MPSAAIPKPISSISCIGRPNVLAISAAFWPACPKRATEATMLSGSASNSASYLSNPLLGSICVGAICAALTIKGVLNCANVCAKPPTGLLGEVLFGAICAALTIKGVLNCANVCAKPPTGLLGEVLLIGGVCKNGSIFTICSCLPCEARDATPPSKSCGVAGGEESIEGAVGD